MQTSGDKVITGDKTLPCDPQHLTNVAHRIRHNGNHLKQCTHVLKTPKK